MIVFTERLRLEPIGPGHAGDLFRVHDDPQVAYWYGGALTTDAARRRARDWGEAWNTKGVHKWMAYDRETNELVGRGGLSLVPVEGVVRLELGWALLSSKWGRGYATEIGRAGLDFAFDRLDAEEVVAFTEPHNVRSRAVMERLGMSYEREFVQDDETFVLYLMRR